MKSNEQQPSAAKPSKAWQKTPFANLIRYVPSGMYFARVRVAGKLIRQSLKTDVLGVAKLKLGDLEKAERGKAETCVVRGKGKMTFKEALDAYLSRIDANVALKERSKEYYRERARALVKSWKDLEKKPIRDISKSDCLEWAGKFSKAASGTAFNNTVKVLRDIIDIGIELGARYDNPAKHVDRMKPSQKDLKLPSQTQFDAFLDVIASSRTPWSSRSLQTVKFLAFTGCRKKEASCVTWADCDFEKGIIRVRETKNGKPRNVPMIPEAKALLEQMRLERPDDAPDVGVIPVHECQISMDEAAKAIGMERITHHDLRHLFATRCIESGVDIPTVSRWLGHSDGGALAMKVYGHLRDQHSVAMAQTVTFSTPKAENIIPIGKAGAA